MNIEIIKKLIARKDEHTSSVVADIQMLNVQIRDLNLKIEEAKAKLSYLEASRVEIATEKAMLVQAIGEQAVTLPAGNSMSRHLGDKFVVQVIGDGSMNAQTYDLQTFDLSDGEPKVRQHTIDVRRYAVMVTLRDGPCTTSALIEAFEKLGFRVSDENEVANLSAILSRTSFFTSENRRWKLDTSKLLAAPRRMP